LRTLNNLPANTKVTLDASHTVNIDYDVIEIIDEFRANAKSKNIDLKVVGLNMETNELESQKSKVLKQGTNLDKTLEPV